MKILKLQNLENNEIKSKEYNIPKFTPDIFQPYFRLNISGSSGTGKTTALINLFNKIYPELDKTYIISATIHNDPKQQEAFLNRENIYVFTEPSIDLLKEIIKQVEELNEEHQEYLRVKKIYKKWQKYEYNESVLTPAELIALYKCDFDPKNMPYNKEIRPNQLLILDDLQGLDILKSKVFENLTIKCRHKNLNMICTTQTFRGISNVWRRNSTGFMIFKTIDLNQLKTIFEEVQGFFKGGWDQFFKIYEYATENKHEFLYIDMNDKDNPIRKNFNLVIKDE